MLWTAEMHGHAWGSTERIGMLWLMGMSRGLCGLNEKNGQGSGRGTTKPCAAHCQGSVNTHITPYGLACLHKHGPTHGLLTPTQCSILCNPYARFTRSHSINMPGFNTAAPFATHAFTKKHCHIATPLIYTLSYHLKMTAVPYRKHKSTTCLPCPPVSQHHKHCSTSLPTPTHCSILSPPVSSLRPDSRVAPPLALALVTRERESMARRGAKAVLRALSACTAVLRAKVKSLESS